MSGSSLRWLGLLLAAVALGFLGWQEWLRRQASVLPPGIVSGNGRIESVQVDVATTYAGRVRTVAVREGDMVEPGQVLAQLDTLELEAELAKGNARIAEIEEQVAQAKAEMRRAAAVAVEQEMRAKVVEAEAQVPLAMAEAFRKGNLGILDYQKIRNVSADTEMRSAIAKDSGKTGPK